MNLFDVIEEARWRRMQEGFSKALGISINTVDQAGNLLPVINQPNTFCLELGGASHYKKCISHLISKITEDSSENFVVCQFGVYLYGVPIDIKRDNVRLGYFIVGPALIQKAKTLEEYERLAEELNISPEKLTNNILSLKKFSFAGIESTVELLNEVANDMIQLSYDSGKIKKRFGVPKAVDDLIKELYLSMYSDGLLKALLDVSLHTSNGSAGSIMILDQATNELSIKFSKGMNEGIAQKARVKMGEGIAGVVAENRKPMLIDDTMQNSKIKNRLKRPDIKSSIICPLEVKNRLFGVMNLNNTDSDKKFSLDTLDLINNLTRLTKTALEMFNPDNNPETSTDL
ncbi:MAG: PocR ligand-binding domain-containing protein [Candidatus Omnitrophota bacterium]|nr:PocR ligand-binding domain-containing protein [Candidatus Omnitrophota bacterium]